MPRSFLVKKHQSTKRAQYRRLRTDTDEVRCSTYEDSLFHSAIPPHHNCPAPGPKPQQRAQSLSSSCALPLGADRLHHPSSPDTFPLSSSEAACKNSKDHKPTESCTKMNLEIQCVTEDHRRREGLLPPSLPLLALFPAIPPSGSGQGSFECLDCHKELLSFSGLAKHKQLRCDWSSKKYFS
ncbi:hypothetical protein L3Q82_011529 [Scortum barcoo]|uniref:Uncharacterized protein n=1 Tax=Scortum barcoo TaxID=214431 RepID=A0ACB8W507_9TELE|nr:hypothetical protein L3Q82_011529 [Scortum barcoo]